MFFQPTHPVPPFQGVTPCRSDCRGTKYPVLVKGTDSKWRYLDYPQCVDFTEILILSERDLGKASSTLMATRVKSVNNDEKELKKV